MAANCTRAQTCTCTCHMCRYGDHTCTAYQHASGCHMLCSPPAPKPAEPRKGRR